MKFELEIDKNRLDKEVFMHLGVVFTETYLRDLFLRNQKLLGACAQGIDTYEREWLSETITEDLIDLSIPCNGESDEAHKKFWDKWIEYITSSEHIDREQSKKFTKEEEDDTKN